MRSVELGHKIIDEQIQRGIPSNRIIIGGFSQGGAIALLVNPLPARSPDFPVLINSLSSPGWPLV
jgi:hypothetical protein